jgi:RNA polymerase sigma-70 factor (ECF subfamily)
MAVITRDFSASAAAGEAGARARLDEARTARTVAATGAAATGAAATGAAATGAAVDISRPPTHGELLGRGDRAAFAELLQQHQPAIYGYLLARLAVPVDAEDLCQEVFLRCYQGREKLPQTDSLRAWLLGIARNVLREHIRIVQRRREVAWTELCLELDEMVQQESPDAGDEALDHLPGCLESLGRSAREALEMRYRARHRLGEIGRLLHRSEGAVKLLMYRARQALKNCLDRKLGAGHE